jgi:hypothetical protein
MEGVAQGVICSPEMKRRRAGVTPTYARALMECCCKHHREGRAAPAARAVPRWMNYAGPSRAGQRHPL